MGAQQSAQERQAIVHLVVTAERLNGQRYMRRWFRNAALQRLFEQGYVRRAVATGHAIFVTGRQMVHAARMRAANQKAAKTRLVSRCLTHWRHASYRARMGKWLAYAAVVRRVFVAMRRHQELLAVPEPVARAKEFRAAAHYDRKLRKWTFHQWVRLHRRIRQVVALRQRMLRRQQHAVMQHWQARVQRARQLAAFSRESRVIRLTEVVFRYVL